MSGDLVTPPRSVRTIGWLVNAALLPGIAVTTYTLGFGYLMQMTWAVGIALIIETLCLTLRGSQQRRAQLTDGSVVMTALLIAIALPPNTSIGIIAVAVVSAVALAKHAFGGLGQNLFNPAMTGYAIVLVSFPAQLALWPITGGPIEGGTVIIDAVTAATPLEQVSHATGTTFLELSQSSGFGELGGLPWQWINIGFLVGGLMLWLLGLIRWRVSLGVLLSLGLLAAANYDSGSSASLGSPLYHWFTGATMLTAFFIATDPVTHPRSHGGQWVFGILVGTLIFVIRSYGTYADGAAFAILIANCTTGVLDQFYRPKITTAARPVPADD